MDLVRLQKALSVEAEHGFNNLEGNQYHFSEFLHLTLSQPSEDVPACDRDKCQDMASRFANYPDLTFSQRQHLVAETRRFLHQIKKATESEPNPLETVAAKKDRKSVV